MKAGIAALAALALAGCATGPTQPRRVAFPDELLQDCPAVEVQTATNGQLAGAVQGLQAALTQCTADKRALRELNKGAE